MFIENEISMRDYHTNLTAFHTSGAHIYPAGYLTDRGSIDTCPAHADYLSDRGGTKNATSPKGRNP